MNIFFPKWKGFQNLFVSKRCNLPSLDFWCSCNSEVGDSIQRDVVLLCPSCRGRLSWEKAQEQWGAASANLGLWVLPVPGSAPAQLLLLHWHSPALWALHSPGLLCCCTSLALRSRDKALAGQVHCTREKLEDILESWVNSKYRGMHQG